MTYDPEEGVVKPRSQEEWLELMLEDGSDYWGEEITEREHTAIRHLYEPFAGRLEELEKELEAVQLSFRLDTAEKQELDYIGERVGVDRRSASKSTGQVEFLRENPAQKDYLIDDGNIVSTGGDSNIEFVTTEEVVLSKGESSVLCDIEAREAGADSNIASDSIQNIVGTIVGVDDVTNPNRVDDGRDKEEDDNYRQRIKTSVGDLDVTSLRAVYQDVNNLQYVRGVKTIDNSADQTNTQLDTHQSEIVVDSEPGHSDEIAQKIFNNVPMGIDLVNGLNGQATQGTASLPNGQTFTILYSNPYEIDIYVDVEITSSGDLSENKVKDAIVSYIGGEKTTGQLVYGDISVGDDVIEGEVEFNIRNIKNVYDVTSLKLGKSSNPSSSSNIGITNEEMAIINHNNISVTISNK